MGVVDYGDHHYHRKAEKQQLKFQSKIGLNV